MEKIRKILITFSEIVEVVLAIGVAVSAQIALATQASFHLI